MSQSLERLFGLLPEFIRYADAEVGSPLRAALAVLEGEYAAIADATAALYDDWFIETCSEWVIPYLGDLVGVRTLDIALASNDAQRALVGNILHYRRRKGTPAALAGAAGDATGWPAHAVPSIDLLAATQSLLHVRPGRGGTVDLRAGVELEAFGTPFDTIARNVQVRAGVPLGHPIGTATSDDGGRYNLGRIGLFFWRLPSYPIGRAEPREVGPGAYTFHPFGIDSPLFNPPKNRTGPPNAALLPVPLDAATLQNEASELDRREFAETGFLAPDPAIRVWVRFAAPNQDKRPVLRFTDLSRWTPLSAGVEDGTEAGLRIPVAVDPALGRLAFPAGVGVDEVAVGYAYAFSGDLGGGPYYRPPRDIAPANWYAIVGERSAYDEMEVVPQGDGGTGRHRCQSLAEAVGLWNQAEAAYAAVADGSDPEPVNGLIEIESDDLQPAPSEPIRLTRSSRLTIRAAAGARPCVVGDLAFAGEPSGSAAPSATLALGGLWIDGGLALSGDLAALGIEDCTLRPAGRPSLRLERKGGQPAACAIAIARSILGPLRLPAETCQLAIADSILDGGGTAAISGPDEGTPGPALRIERATVFGRVEVVELYHASETLFVDPVMVVRCMSGLVLNSYVPPGSVTPHGQANVPLLGSGVVIPSFTSRVYGQPGYAQLGPLCPPELSNGPHGEIGAFHGLRQPEKMALIPAIAAEFLPWGLEAEIVFAT